MDVRTAVPVAARALPRPVGLRFGLSTTSDPAAPVAGRACNYSGMLRRRNPQPHDRSAARGAGDAASAAVAGIAPHPRSVSGYRLVRKLGEGDRCEVHLAIPDAVADVVPQPVALKLARPGVTASSLLLEADALSRCSHPHLLHLFDVAQAAGTDAAPDGYLRVTLPAPCLVVERLPRGSLATLLGARGTLNAGEAVTIIGPVIDAVMALHAAGVVHGRIAANAVFFRESGAPVLCRFGAATLMPPGSSSAVLDDHPGVRGDRRDLARLLAVVLDRVDEPAADGVLAEVHLLASGACDARSLAAVAERLFSLAPAEPIDFTPPLAELDALGAGTGVASRAARVPARLRGRSTLLLPDRARGRSPERVAAVVATLAERARGLIGSARPRFWLTGGGVALAVFVALLSIPAGGTDGVDAVRSTGAPAAVAEPAPGSPVQKPGASAAVLGDDPVSALVVLLAARRDCLVQLSEQCFTAVDQTGSAALGADRALVRDVRGGAELPVLDPVSQESVKLLQRLGDSALLSVASAGANSKPASVLVMRTEAGWRVRDYLEE